MASDNKRRRYTCQQALDFIVNDSDSEGPYVESDSEMTDLSNDARNSPSERSSVTVTPAISESSDSDDEMPRPIRRPRQQRAVGVRGRGWGRGRGGRGVNNAQGERPAIVNGVGVGDIPLAAETVLVNGRNLNWDTYDGVEVALVNGYIVYCKDAGEDAVPPKVFREHVVSGLLEGYKKKASRRGRPSTDVPTRLTERHFAGKYEDPKYKPDCVVCSSRTKEGWKRKQTNYMCKQCNLPMCFIPCHEIYHTNKNFQQEAARVVYNL